ncbi:MULTISPECIES: MFS transporter [Methylobacterium]|jgi:MFS transporter, MHS family, proline/betaine transporter|uniref:MFS transporter n=2 Tax=Methylobacteriaceae TaxID=119045 RepID=UPI000376A1AF|nr:MULTISPECIES: MFS transporter [Methylobacterium]MBN4094845.1 MFS transporter [Methylobacterium sp. OT2]UIN32762.1 MFS transporter [Methylobacterium oryzae]SEP40716.1 Na+/melibiose symporter [Methylobacterium sp. UNC300MFChir4.1]SFE94052.1 Na+/melibiose symporter [Methylobacterium sp. 13MFTsu3.1M2]
MQTAATFASDPPALARPTGRQTATAAMASLFGWGLDLFDLFILLYVAPVVGTLFFPADKPMLSLAGAYASFAVTLLIRPLGSALFGSYADRFGRRRALMVAVIGVGLSTAVFGLLPTVGQIGWLATAIFLFFRLVQGVFVGGVVAASHTIGTESVPERWRGLMSGAVGSGGSAIGGLLASLVFYLVSLMAPGEAFADWGWRVMFFSGLLTSVIGLILFRNLEESPIFKELQARKAALREGAPTKASPIRSLFSPSNRGSFAVATLISFGGGAAYYLTSGYLPTLLKLVNGVPNATASMILIGANVAAAIGACGMGELSQHIGRKRSFLLMGVIRLFAFPVLFLTMANTTSLMGVAACAFLLSLIANASYAPLLIFLNEKFPTAVRATGTGLTWNIGFALGGMLPTFVSLIADGPTQIPMVLTVVMTCVTLVYLVGAVITPETQGNLDRA